MTEEEILERWQKREPSGSRFISDTTLRAMTDDLPRTNKRQDQGFASGGFASGGFATAAIVPEVNQFRVSQIYTSTTGSASASTPGVGGATDMTSFTITYEAMLETAPDPEPIQVGNQLMEKLRVIGLKLELSVQTIKARFHADFFAVAAAAELGWAKVSFSCDIHPAQALENLLPAQGVYDITKYRDLLDGVIRVKAALADARGLQPEVYYRPIRAAFSAEDEIAEAQAVALAAASLANRKSLGDAMTNARKVGIKESIVGAAYRYFWPLGKEDDDPPAAVRAVARQWLGW